MPAPITPDVHLAWAAPPTPTPDATVTPAPPLAYARPMLRPLPHLPPDDCITLDQEARMRVAVALDVITSATRRIAPGPTVLVQATQAWLRLRGRAQDAEAIAELLGHAHSPQGKARARISRGLTRAASGQQPHGRDALGAVTTPQQVTAANRAIEAAGAIIVAEATLWLVARERVDYRRG